MIPGADALVWMRSRIQSSVEVQQAILDSETLLAQIVRVGRRMADALLDRHQILLFGNGGSAADAQHIAAELVGRFYTERLALPAIALTGNTSVLTAVGNDYDFTRVFARQIEAHGRPGDVAVGISTSGTSPNVVRGIEVAGSLGLYTVALTGMHGGDLQAMAEECICVPSTDTPRIQEAHILIGHLLCEWVEQAMLGTGT